MVKLPTETLPAWTGYEPASRDGTSKVTENEPESLAVVVATSWPPKLIVMDSPGSKF
jgi:hypothetical protein